MESKKENKKELGLIIKVLKSLEGFQRLNKKQQKIIISSLIIQDRADRFFKSRFDFDKAKKYDVSCLFVTDYNCHRAVASIDRSRTGILKTFVYPKEEVGNEHIVDKHISFPNIESDQEHSTRFIKMSSPEDLKDYLRRNYPAIVKVNGSDESRNHSLLVIDIVEIKGEPYYFIWDKRGLGGYPFRVYTLKIATAWDRDKEFLVKKVDP